MHSLEIIELQFEKECHTLLCILELYTYIIHKLSLKNAWLPPTFLWISITLGKIYVSCIIINRGKNSFELLGTFLKLQPTPVHHYFLATIDMSLFKKK